MKLEDDYLQLNYLKVKHLNYLKVKHLNYLKVKADLSIKYRISNESSMHNYVIKVNVFFVLFQCYMQCQVSQVNC